MSESTLVEMPHCWKSHVTAHMCFKETKQIVPDSTVPLLLFIRVFPVGKMWWLIAFIGNTYESIVKMSYVLLKLNVSVPTCL